MKLLAVDTSGPVCGVAILTEDGIRHECAVMNHKTHSVNLLPMIDNAFQSTGLTIQDMDRLAVVVGPGSFTGVRLGVSTVKGLAHGAGKPCVAVNALEAMAAGISGFSGVVCPIQDARAGQVYGAAFSAGENRPNRLMADTPMKVEDYVAEISRFGDRFLFLGDGMPCIGKSCKPYWGMLPRSRSRIRRSCARQQWRTLRRWRRKRLIT